METRDDLRFALDDVERSAVGFRDTRDEVDDEEREQPEPEPAQRTAGLLRDDVAQVQAAG